MKHGEKTEMIIICVFDIIRMANAFPHTATETLTSLIADGVMILEFFTVSTAG